MHPEHIPLDTWLEADADYICDAVAATGGTVATIAETPHFHQLAIGLADGRHASWTRSAGVTEWTLHAYPRPGWCTQYVHTPEGDIEVLVEDLTFEYMQRPLIARLELHQWQELDEHQRLRFTHVFNHTISATAAWQLARGTRDS